MPTPAEAKALFRAFWRTGSKFPDYNIKEYIKRKTKDGFRSAQSITDPAQLDLVWKQAGEQLKVAQRQLVVYSLYSHGRKNVMELPRAAA